MFKKGDYVFVKVNTEIETGEIVSDWAGKVIEVYEDSNLCLVELDAPTINSLTDASLQNCLDEGCSFSKYTFGYEDLVKAPRRDTDQQLAAAHLRLEERVADLEGDYSDLDYDTRLKKLHAWKKRWINAFIESSLFNTLSEIEQEEAGFVLDTFITFMFEYENLLPNEWNADAASKICLEVVPRKVMADKESFDAFAPALIQFLQFLDSKHLVSSAKSIIREINQIKDQIAVLAADPRRWGMTKSFMMDAKASGVDTNDDTEIQRYLMLKQAAAFQSRPTQPGSLPPIDPFKGLERNQRITVQYESGNIVENIKFKKVEPDLRLGLCKIVKR